SPPGAGARGPSGSDRTSGRRRRPYLAGLQGLPVNLRVFPAGWPSCSTFLLTLRRVATLAYCAVRKLAFSVVLVLAYRVERKLAYPADIAVNLVKTGSEIRRI